MQIYFAGSIRGGRSDAAVYEALIAYLRSFGKVLTEHVGNRQLTPSGDDGPNDRYIHDRDMTWLLACDRVVAEVSTPSLGVGYELGWACALKKPVLCLYRSGAKHRLSAMIAGSGKIQTSAYDSLQEARTVIENFMAEAAHAAGPQRIKPGDSSDAYCP